MYENNMASYLKRYEKLIRLVQRDEAHDKPISCSKCRYHQSDFKYRKCLFTRCPYKVEMDVFRRRPLRRDITVKVEAVRMDV